jgi:amino acid adenylation domain-containing protein
MDLEAQRSFSSYIIGNNSLCIQCAKILLENNHKIYGIATSDPYVERWSQDLSIPCLYLSEDDGLVSENLFDFFSQRPFDYLFSIDNPVIFQDNILGLPQVFSINYHDALLPKYGGVNATSWTIYNREQIHGITWHVIEKKVDAGDILKQSSVELSEKETALTLNTKCYECAITSFRELIDELASGSVKRKPQNLRERTFFPSYKKPTNVCTLDWLQSSDQLNSLVRSLNHGDYPNNLGMPKLYANGDFIITTKLDVLDSKSDSPPGTILAIDDTCIHVSTADFDVAISGFRQIDGHHLRVLDVVEQLDLQIGFQFPKLDPDWGDRITAYNRKIHQHETYWVKRLRVLESLQLPFIERETLNPRNGNYKRKTLVMPDYVKTHQHNHNYDQSYGEFVLSIFAIYLARLTGTFNFDIGYRNPYLRKTIIERGLDRLFSSYIPLRVELDDTQRLPFGLASLETQITVCKKRKTFVLDAIARYPELRSLNNIQQIINVILEIVESEQDLDSYEKPNGSTLILRIPEDNTANGVSQILWIYNANEIDPNNIIRMQEQFLILLKSVIENPEQYIVSLPLLSELERYQILVEWNQKQVDYPHNKCLHQLFEAQAEKAPENLAVVFENETLTYKELNIRSNKLSHSLRKIGVGPEVLVGLFIESSLDMIIGLLGILKAGGAYVPLTLADPKERLAFILDETEAKVLLTKESLKRQLPPTNAVVFFLDSDWENLDVDFTENSASGPTADNLAYVIYTSGSTGKPKGVMMSHRSLVNRFLWGLDMFQRNGDDRVLQQFSLSFDYSVWEIFIALTSGACLVLAKPYGQRDSEYITRLIKERNITIAGFVPSMLNAFLNETNIENLKSLRQVFTGGEEISIKLLKKYFEKLSASLYNTYGPTEACIDATIWLCRPDIRSSPVPIGRPVANSKLYILDKYLQVVPVGNPGELYISGVCLARGYLKSPELTAEKFIPDPFNQDPGARLYKTGDLVRYLPDGNIVFLGRIDNQVKIRGFRIELGEIEAMLSQNPAVREAVVLAREEPNQKQLVAYIVADEKPLPTIFEIRTWLKHRLPDYMVPSAYVFLDNLPLTSSGKVNRRVLPAPKQSDRIVESAYVKPGNDLDIQLVRIWENVLNLKPIGVRDNFFEIGGDSLLAVSLFLEIEHKLDTRLPLVTLFQAPTIVQLATQIREEQQTKHKSSLVAINPKGSKPPIFIIHGQGGVVLALNELRKYLDEDQPLYGLQSKGLSGETAPLYTIEDMAAHYCKEIRLLYPEGPYMLGGFSMGGWIAVEMANQLHRQGQHVALVALLDTAANSLPFMNNWQKLSERVRFLTARVQYHVRKIVFLSLSEKREYFQNILIKYRNRKGYQRREKRLFEKEIDQDQLPEYLQQVKDANRIAGNKYNFHYNLKIFSGKVTLFRSEMREKRKFKWENYARNIDIEIHHIPGDHDTFRTEPHVQVLAKKLQACINRAITEVKSV